MITNAVIHMSGPSGNGRGPSWRRGGTEEGFFTWPLAAWCFSKTAEDAMNKALIGPWKTWDLGELHSHSCKYWWTYIIFKFFFFSNEKTESLRVWLAWKPTANKSSDIWTPGALITNPQLLPQLPCSKRRHSKLQCFTNFLSSLKTYFNA